VSPQVALPQQFDVLPVSFYGVPKSGVGINKAGARLNLPNPMAASLTLYVTQTELSTDLPEAVQLDVAAAEALAGMPLQFVCLMYLLIILIWLVFHAATRFFYSIAVYRQYSTIV
jgi:hypothetical protein